MERMTRAQKYASLREEISKSSSLQDQNRKSEENITNLKEKLGNFDSKFFGTSHTTTKIDIKPVKQTTETNKLEPVDRPFREINTDVMNNIIEDVRKTDKDYSEEDTRVNIIKKLNLEINQNQFPRMQSSMIKERIENSREVKHIVSELERSTNTLDVNINKNMAKLQIKLAELEKMKNASNYSKDDVRRVESEIKEVKDVIATQTSELRLNSKDFSNYDIEKKMKGIEDSIVKSKRTKIYGLLSVAIFAGIVGLAVLILKLVMG